jgi:hypothetical protein
MFSGRLGPPRLDKFFAIIEVADSMQQDMQIKNKTLNALVVRNQDQDQYHEKDNDNDNENENDKPRT